LSGIIRRRNGETKTEAVRGSAPAAKPDKLVEDIDFGELSLEEFAQKIEKPAKSGASDIGVQTIQQFEKERDKFQDLHSAISGCDDVSKSVELYLNDFQNELGAVSAEIETLQTRSVQLNAMLENRRNVEQLLGPAVEEISISPAAVRMIVEGPIDENWVKALNDIESRTASIESKIAGSSSTKAIDDVRPLLEDIKKKVSLAMAVLIRILIRVRPLKEFEITWFRRCGHCDRPISTPKSFSNSAWFVTRTCIATSQEPIQYWLGKSPKRISTRCVGTITHTLAATFKRWERSRSTLVTEMKF
jgi:hypothetical protein